MAVTNTPLTSGGSATDGTSQATASVTPAGNELIEVTLMVCFSAARASPGPNVTAAGNGITYTEVARRQAHLDTGGYWYCEYLYRGMAASPSAGAITFTSPVNVLSWAWSVSSKGGVDTTGTNGSGAVVQAVAGNADNATTLSINLAAFGSVNNATAGYFASGHDATTRYTFTPGTGFTEIHDTGAEFVDVGTQWRVDNDTTVDTTVSAASNLAGIAIEIKAAAAGSPQTVTPGGIASAEAHGVSALTLTLLASAIASLETFGVAVVSPGAVLVQPGAMASAEAFGPVIVVPGAVVLLVPGLTTAEAFGLAQVLGGVVAEVQGGCNTGLPIFFLYTSRRYYQ